MNEEFCTSLLGKNGCESHLQAKGISYDGIDDQSNKTLFYFQGKLVAIWNKSYNVLATGQDIVSS